MLVSVQFDKCQRLLEYVVSQGADQHIAFVGRYHSKAAYADHYRIEAGELSPLVHDACGIKAVCTRAGQPLLTVLQSFC